MSKKEYKNITKKSSALLSKGEGTSIEFKEKIKGLHTDDLVAFANSEKGGTIFIGVKEKKGTNGKQTGIPCGCDISDKAKLEIMNKALSCAPPVQVNIYIENTSAHPFFRVEIPSGEQKPYCTNAGTYKIREDGRNQPLHPKQLLSIFLVSEGEEFKSRFSQAAEELEEKMSSTLDTVQDLENIITDKIEDIASSMGWAEFEASNANSTIESVYDMTRAINKKATNQEKRMLSALQKLETNDPVKEELKQELLESIIKQFKKDEKLFEAAIKQEDLQITYKPPEGIEFTKIDMKELIAQAIKILKSEKYSAAKPS